MIAEGTFADMLPEFHTWAYVIMNHSIGTDSMTSRGWGRRSKPHGDAGLPSDPPKEHFREDWKTTTGRSGNNIPIRS